MTRYIIRRILWAAVLLFSVTVVTFVIFFVTPTDPGKLVAGKGAGPDDVARARHYLGLDKPVPGSTRSFSVASPASAGTGTTTRSGTSSSSGPRSGSRSPRVRT